MFGRLNTEYIHNLPGNSKATKNVRMVSGSHLPKKLAEWNIEALYFGIRHWATEFYDQERHPALDESPREAFMRGLRESGTRPQRQILFNRDFLIATCPPVGYGGARKVNPQRGVKVNEMYYWNAEFHASHVAGQTLPVRYDPWDASSVYVRVKDQWLQAICRNLRQLGQLTELERRAMTEEYGRRSINTPADDARAMQRLREFMQTFTPEGALATDLERQAENKALYDRLELASIEPVVQPTQDSPLIRTWTADLPQAKTQVKARAKPAADASTAPVREATEFDPFPDLEYF
jgi:putative transposase